MTDADFIKWLERGGLRVALVEVDTDVPRFLSTVPYTTLPTDTPANRPYLPVVASGFPFTERLSLDGNASINVGAIDLHNEDHALDAWIHEVWVNRSIRVYIGDVDWLIEDFRLIFSGIIAEFTPSVPGRLSIVLRNKLERLNTPVTETMLGGTTPNKDRNLPITLGECHNVTPLLVDPAEHEYQWNIGSSERLIEVRDNGVPIPSVVTLATGKFKLTGSSVGQITASVQGRTPYVSDVSGIVQLLATQYGSTTERLTSGDLDAANLSAFAAACPQAIGISITDRANVLQCCQQVADAVGAQVVMSQQGLLRLVRIDLPGVGTPLAITPKDYEHGSLSVREQSEVIAGVKLGYCRNWTMQQTLETGIPESHRGMYEQEYLTVTVRDATVASAYRLFADPPQKDTLLLTELDATVEAQRQLDLWKVQRTVFKIKGYSHLLLTELGQAVDLSGYYFDLQDGKQGIIIGKQSDWFTGWIELEILV